MKKIGITTTVPQEVLIAAGYKVIDLNNIFVTSNNYMEYIDIAERDGFPKSMCAWIKGLYGVCIKEGIDEVVGVVEGDCSNTRALVEVLKLKGINIYPFAYPNSHKLEDVKKSLDDFMDIFNVKKSDVENVRNRLNKVRELLIEVDNLTVDGYATGFENHLYLVSSSDFNGDYLEFENMLKEKIKEIKDRNKKDYPIRLAYIGVPPMMGDIYDFVEGIDAKIVYNEVQREFSFPRFKNNKDIYEQYYDYTYPYDIEFRLQEVKRQIKERKIDGVIHYTQAFCYRGIEDIIVKSKLDVPVINIEGDKLNELDARTKLRLEAFVDMLKDRKEWRR